MDCHKVAIDGQSFTLANNHGANEQYKHIASPVIRDQQMEVYMWESFWNGKEDVGGDRAPTLEAHSVMMLQPTG